MEHAGTSEDCFAALRGERHPADLDKADNIIQVCVLRGIRHHHGFANQLRNAHGNPEFIRALNARAIMSNEIPNIAQQEHVPYCIWYPDLASEETYRAVAKRYPQMGYQVGRACAVAGYPELYRELGLLPDNSIAEEARDNLARNGGRSQDILDSIVKQHPRWMVMNDYIGIVQDPVLVEHGMNGDTAVRSSLLFTRSFRDPRMVKRINGMGKIASRDKNLRGEPIAPHYFNITEDWSVDEYTCAESSGEYPDTIRVVELPDNEKMQALLWNPLPWDLPAGDKDLLILMAAYYGNIDRYARLRRPVEVAAQEDACVYRGIHHNTAFVRWMFDQPGNKRFMPAIHARFIMSNDLSRISADSPPDDELPYQIWYPTLAAPDTYVELARRRPSMRPVVARALIVANYQDSWDRDMDWDFEPTVEMLDEAAASPNPHYLAFLRERSPIPVEEGAHNYYNSNACRVETYDSLCLPHAVSLDSVEWDIVDRLPYVYNPRGMKPTIDVVEHFIAAPAETRPPNDEHGPIYLPNLWLEQRRGGLSPQEKVEHDYRGPGRWVQGRGRGRPRLV